MEFNIFRLSEQNEREATFHAIPWHIRVFRESHIERGKCGLHRNRECYAPENPRLCLIMWHFKH